jgi:hypothetical protein
MGIFEPTGGAAASADDADADSGIGIAGLRITLHIDGGMNGDPVDQWILRDGGLIHLEVDDLARVG